MSIKIILLLAGIGHILCAVTDCLFTYTPNGRFSFSDMKDADTMAEKFNGMSLDRLKCGILLGIAAITMECFGYIRLSEWVKSTAPIFGEVMYISCIILFLNIVVHHVVCGTAEWFYVRSGCTNESLEAVKDYFKSTSLTMYIGYLALLVYSFAFLIAVLCRDLNVPLWLAVFNQLPLFIILAPTKLPAKGNIAGAVMFIGLAVVI